MGERITIAASPSASLPVRSAYKPARVSADRLVRRPDLITRMMTERSARLRRYRSWMRLSDGRLVEGPTVEVAIRSTFESPGVELRYGRWDIEESEGARPTYMWIVTPEGVSVTLWKVPPTELSVIAPTIKIS